VRPAALENSIATRDRRMGAVAKADHTDQAVTRRAQAEEDGCVAHRAEMLVTHDYRHGLAAPDRLNPAGTQLLGIPSGAMVCHAASNRAEPTACPNGLQWAAAAMQAAGAHVTLTEPYGAV
jgi:hypothetical protein